MPAFVGVFAALALVGVYLLARYVAAGGGPRTGPWCGLLVLVVVVLSATALIVSIYYRMPTVWVVTLVTAAAAAVALLVRIGMDVRWQPSRAVATVAMLLVADAMLVFAMIALPPGQTLVPLFETSAQQMAEADGFGVLLAPGEQMFTEYKPITKIDESGGGVQIQYERFTLLERAAKGPLDHAALRKALAAGVDPLTAGGARITDDATYAELEVDGRPALGVEYGDRNAVEKQGIGDESVRVLAFERDGVEVRIYSHGWMQYEPSNDTYTQVDALSLDELLRIAVSLEPRE